MLHFPLKPDLEMFARRNHIYKSACLQLIGKMLPVGLDLVENYITVRANLIKTDSTLKGTKIEKFRENTWVQVMKNAVYFVYFYL